MKFKLAVPRNVLTAHQIGLIEGVLGEGMLGVVTKNFPNWKQRALDGDIAGGEIIIQDTDMTKPIKGLKPGIHVTISLVSFRPDRDLDGLATDTIKLIKQTKDDEGGLFMSKIGVFVQMSLNRMVVKAGTAGVYTSSGDGESLLEYSG